MTRDNIARFDETCEKHVAILRLFHEAGGKYSKDPQLYDILEIRDTNLPRLFEIFAAAEREACAKECDATNLFDMPITVEVAAIRKCAAAIRARSKT
jgi:hypothetical protein